MNIQVKLKPKTGKNMEIQSVMTSVVNMATEMKIKRELNKKHEQ